MRFLIDHNVQVSVQRVLKELEHDVVLSKDAVGQDAEDQLVATAAVEQDRILVSHDRDMKRIQRYLSAKHRERYTNLNRVMLQCPEPVAADRLRDVHTLVQFEFDRSQELETPMLIWVQEKAVRIYR